MLENEYQNEDNRPEQANFAHVVAGSATNPTAPIEEGKPAEAVTDPGQEMPQISPPECAPTLVSPLRAKLRRMFFFGTVVLVNLIAVLWMADLFNRQGFHKSHILLLGIFALLNSLLVLGSFHALAGVWDWLFSWRSVKITQFTRGGDTALAHRYAVVMPVYNEDIVKVCARVEAIYRSIEATGRLASFDFFILSDTTQLNLWVEEEVAWTNMSRKLNAFGRIFYRRRRINENRKAGNIGDFVKTWGGRYEGMLVLDADSLMEGRDIVAMCRVMDVNPRLGILQTPPKLIRGSSVFTRLQQFAMRLYGPLFIRGLNFWQLGQGSYWGHNALIRVKPFSEFCELPALPGKEPFGGKILSHDFVEAALMVKAGWEVWLAWDIEGTYEEAPPTLIDHLKRDRRWCQGNLQHMWLVFARKFPFPSRAHLFMGIMAYLGSPVWFLFLLISTWVAWDFRTSDLSQLPYDGFVGKYLGLNGAEQAWYLAGFVLILLFAPKVLAYLGMLFQPRVRRGFGSIFSLSIGVFLEALLSALLAPSIMVSHTLMVLGMVLGRSVNWGNQTRETDGTTWSEAIRYHGPAIVLGIAWSALAWYIGKSFFLWMSPILVGLVFSAHVSVWTSRSRYGRALQRQRILATPEETLTPEVIRLADGSSAAVDLALTAHAPQREGAMAAVVDPYVNGVHVSLLDPDNDEIPTDLLEKWLVNGPDSLQKNEMAEVMYSAQGMLQMHRNVWSLPFEQMHSAWSRAVESYRTRAEDFSSADAV
jgi:membrane glycosyltransferase